MGKYGIILNVELCHLEGYNILELLHNSSRFLVFGRFTLFENDVINIEKNHTIENF